MHMIVSYMLVISWGCCLKDSERFLNGIILCISIREKLESDGVNMRHIDIKEYLVSEKIIAQHIHNRGRTSAEGLLLSFLKNLII